MPVTSSFSVQFFKVREDRRLGSGSFGDVFACSFGYSNKIQCVIKKAKRNAYEDLILEGRILKAVFDDPPDWRQKYFTFLYGFSEKPCGLVLERFFGQSIKQYAQQKLENDWVKRLIDVSNALSFLHSREILHLDLHTSNVMVSKETSKIIDFGKATLIKHPVTYSLDPVEKEEYNKRYQQIEYELRNEKNCKTNYCSDVYSLGAIILFITEKCVIAGETKSKLRRIGESCCAPRCVRNSLAVVILDLADIESE